MRLHDVSKIRAAQVDDFSDGKLREGNTGSTTPAQLLRTANDVRSEKNWHLSVSDQSCNPFSTHEPWVIHVRDRASTTQHANPPDLPEVIATPSCKAESAIDVTMPSFSVFSRFIYR
jgi:hypothetical protein